MGNRYLPLGIVAVVILQLVFTYTPPFQAMFGNEAIPIWVWPWLLVGGLVFFLVVEVEKFVIRSSELIADRGHRGGSRRVSPSAAPDCRCFTKFSGGRSPAIRCDQQDGDGAPGVTPKCLETRDHVDAKNGFIRVQLSRRYRIQRRSAMGELQLTQCVCALLQLNEGNRRIEKRVRLRRSRRKIASRLDWRRSDERRRN